MLERGNRMGRYTIERDLGEGGMGRVYEAHDELLDRRVAVKVLRVQGGLSSEEREEATRRLLREARAAARLDHPNVVAVYDVGELDGAPFFAMELVKGRSLRACIGDPGTSADRKLAWLLDVARALSAAHKAGIVHRDVKPENIVVRDDGVVKVLDFGIARRNRTNVDPTAPTESPALSTLTADGVAVGTPLYMTPEQIRGDDLDGRTDQFAWAVVAHELFTGKLPWKGKDALGVVASILTDAPPALRHRASDVPEVVERVIGRCLSKSPADRFASMDDVIAALTAAEAAAPGPAPSGKREALPAAPAAIAAPKGAEAAPRAAVPPAAPGPAMSPNAGKTAAFRYSDEDLREILARATEERKNETGALTHAEILEIASEAGLDPSAVDRAARAMQAEKKPQTAQAGSDRAAAPASGAVPSAALAVDAHAQREERREKVRSFFRHAATFAVVNGFFYFFFHAPSWQRWVLFGWGLGLAMQLVSLVFPKEKQGNREPKRKRREREREIEEKARERAIEEGVERMIEATIRRALRVSGAVPAGDGARVRVAPAKPETSVSSPSAAEQERDAQALAEAAEHEAHGRALSGER